MGALQLTLRLASPPSSFPLPTTSAPTPTPGHTEHPHRLLHVLGIQPHRAVVNPRAWQDRCRPTRGCWETASWPSAGLLRGPSQASPAATALCKALRTFQGNPSAFLPLWHLASSESCPGNAGAFSVSSDTPTAWVSTAEASGPHFGKLPCNHAGRRQGQAHKLHAVQKPSCSSLGMGAGLGAGVRQGAPMPLPLPPRTDGN